MRGSGYDGVAGLGCPGGCRGTSGLYEWVQGVDGLGHVVGRWQPMGDAADPSHIPGGAIGGLAEGDDGQLYEWVQGVDGLGNPVGFWKQIKRGVRQLRRVAKAALPIARQFAPFVPGGAAVLTAATPLLRRVGVAGADGLGELYEAADGSLYQVQGIDADDELHGVDAADDLEGIEADDLEGIGADDLDGVGADDELSGAFAAGDELDGFAADDDLNGLAADDALDGFASDDAFAGVEDGDIEGYVRDPRFAGVGGYRRERPPRTRPFAPSPHAPMWTPLW